MKGLATVSTAHWKGLKKLARSIVSFTFMGVVVETMTMMTFMTTLIIMEFIYGILYPLHQQMGGMHCQVGEGVVTLGENYDYYHHPWRYQETSIETYLEISYCLKRQCTDLQAIFSSLVYGKTSTNHHLVEN